MKRDLFNKIVGVVSIYYDIDLFQIIEVTEMLIYKLKTTFKNSNDEKNNH